MSYQQPGGAPQNPNPPQGQPSSGGYLPPPTQQQPYSQQQGYPQQPYGNPAPDPYQTPSYGGQQGYGPAGAYGQVQPQPGQTAYQPVQQPAKSGVLGLISFAVLALCVIGASIAGFQMVTAIGPIAASVAASSGSTNIDQAILAQALQDQIMSTLSLQTMILNVTSSLGFAAWIAGIVATVTRRGRGWGVTTIILGVLAPIIAFVVMMVALMPAMGMLVR